MTRMGGDERRRQLIAEATRHFGSQGFEGTSLDEIADAAGVRKQTLLYYFPNKDALIEACVENVAARLADSLEHALEDDFSSPWDRVERVINALFALAEEWPEFPMFVREASWRGPHVIAKIADVLEPLRRRALEFIARSMDEGDFRKQDPTLLLFTLYTAVVGSLTEAGVLRAVAGGDRGADALKRRQAELIAFVRGALLRD